MMKVKPILVVCILIFLFSVQAFAVEAKIVTLTDGIPSSDGDYILASGDINGDKKSEVVIYGIYQGSLNVFF